jgi:hypothetical protein
LENCFRVFGQIICCKVAVSSTGVSLRKGFIQYEMETEAEAAIDVMDQVKIKVRYLPPPPPTPRRVVDPDSPWSVYPYCREIITVRGQSYVFRLPKY